MPKFDEAKKLDHFRGLTSTLRLEDHYLENSYKVTLELGPFPASELRSLVKLLKKRLKRRLREASRDDEIFILHNPRRLFIALMHEYDQDVAYRHGRTFQYAGPGLFVLRHRWYCLPSDHLPSETTVAWNRASVLDRAIAGDLEGELIEFAYRPSGNKELERTYWGKAQKLQAETLTVTHPYGVRTYRLEWLSRVHGLQAPERVAHSQTILTVEFRKMKRGSSQVIFRQEERRSAAERKKLLISSR